MMKQLLFLIVQHGYSTFNDWYIWDMAGMLLTEVPDWHTA